MVIYFKHTYVHTSINTIFIVILLSILYALNLVNMTLTLYVGEDQYGQLYYPIRLGDILHDKRLLK